MTYYIHETFSISLQCHNPPPLHDGHKRTEPVYARMGVKQGCPLSPLLFALYVNDVDDVFNDCRGAVTGSPDMNVTHLLYADDLTLLSNDDKDLQLMLDRLQSYSARKGLLVNCEKSHVVVFNSQGVEQQPRFNYGTVPLMFKEQYKYLGVIFHRDCNRNHMGDALEHMCRAFNGGIA
eukprot:CAMPEP_0202907918 /NCGR_PEP_ID=MMETSP1392-20130828/44237_1 /ASSEMBLY_ACC=CAM_ASM_000868 /TAXON_ID=225041 /ORGANISM="Chlamydomonas chlamydogama, Strain SAG 11-48b" /LENGTH=177 /DNA_ID=CAMNT_0049596999 /DNA_START=40 /DNA_END=573 /DNA_ORIENTATION=+